MIEQIQSFLQLKMKYFGQFWSYINLGIIVCSWTSVGIFVWKYYTDNILTNLFAFLCFFSRTIQHAIKDLLSFLLMFSIVFFAFVCLFYLLFVSKLSTCSNVINTAEMLFAMAPTKYNVHDLVDAYPSLGPFCFSCIYLFKNVYIDYH
jgi:hypothetical protein